jgi:CubicO group peptidase (beta-lactamase class C family)
MDRRHFVTLLATTAAGAAASGCRSAGSAKVTPSAPVRSWSAVRRLLDEYVAAGKVAGAAAALAYDGAPLSYLSAGRIALDADAAPFDAGTVCRIYSMSKPVTGTAAMLLVERGSIQLDQPVREVIPEFRGLRVAVDPERGLESRPAARVMTMRHLLTHTSGLGYWTPGTGLSALTAAYRARGITPGNYGARLNRPGYGPQASSLDEMVQRVAELPLLAEPGTAWHYSIGLDVMGLVIERVSGRSFAEFLRAELFAPLAMHSTGFQVPVAALPRLSTNYNVTPEGLRPGDEAATSVWRRPPTLPAGGGGLVSTARDFARFGAMLLSDGMLDGKRVLRTATARLVRSNLLPPGVSYALGGGFGAGARVAQPGANQQRFGAPGTMSWSGAAGTVWWIDPTRRANVVLMTQFMPPDSYPVRDDLIAAISADLGTPI